MVIDSHCHLHDAAFTDVPETVRLALAHDVYGVVGVGCDLESNARTLAATRGAAPKGVWACLGFHPDWTLSDADLERVEAQVHEHHAHICLLYTSPSPRDS